MTLSALGIFSAAGAGGGAFASDYELVATTILGSAQSSVVLDLSGLSSTYRHIQIRGVARSTSGSSRDWFFVRMNSTSLTQGHELRGEGGVFNGSILIGSDVGFGLLTSGGAPTGQFGAFVMDILDTFSTTKNKTLRTLAGNPGSEPNVHLTSGFLNNTAATTSVTLIPRDGPNIAAGSRFSIYGIKG
jgi:hypothetical protein